MRSMYLLKVVDLLYLEGNKERDIVQVYTMIASGYSGQQSLSYLVKAMALIDELGQDEDILALKAQTLVLIADQL